MIISYDFDDTLYDFRKGTLIESVYAIFKADVAAGHKVVITTYRNRHQLADIRRLFPGVTIWATGGGNKDDILIRRGVTRHYDDDLLLCNALLDSTCEPVYICHEQDMQRFIPDGMRTLLIYPQ